MLSTIFFVLMAFVLVTNLTAYVIGAAEVLAGFLPIPLFAAKLVFYVAAAAVVVFGLKAVGISEKFAVALIFVLIGVLAVASFMVPAHPLPMEPDCQGMCCLSLPWRCFLLVRFSPFRRQSKG